MRTTLELLVKRSGLTERDRVSIVSFDSQVKLELPLEKMDRTEIVNNTRVTERFHNNLIQGVEQGLDDMAAGDAKAGAS